MSKDRLLVIGSNSFSGSHFVAEAMKAGFDVWGISRSPEPKEVFLAYKWDSLNTREGQGQFEFNQLDINTDMDRVRELIDLVRPNYIANFAAQGMVSESWQYPSQWYKTNLMAHVELVEHLRGKDFMNKYLQVSTPEVYGDTRGKWVDESCALNPSTPYAVSKAACDLHLRALYKTYKFPVVFTRAANVYGPGQQLYRVIPRAILSARTRRPFELHGGGSSVRSFIHIADVVRSSLDLCVNAKPGSVWHLSAKEVISIRSLIEMICELCQVNFSDIVKITGDRISKDQSYLIDSRSARSRQDWSSEISLTVGVKETCDWVDDNIDTLISENWNYVHKE